MALFELFVLFCLLLRAGGETASVVLNLPSVGSFSTASASNESLTLENLNDVNDKVQVLFALCRETIVTSSTLGSNHPEIIGGIDQIFQDTLGTIQHAKEATIGPASIHLVHDNVRATLVALKKCKELIDRATHLEGGVGPWLANEQQVPAQDHAVEAAQGDGPSLLELLKAHIQDAPATTSSSVVAWEEVTDLKMICHLLLFQSTYRLAPYPSPSFLLPTLLSFSVSFFVILFVNCRLIFSSFVRFRFRCSWRRAGGRRQRLGEGAKERFC